MLRDLFADPALAADKRYADVLRGYLRSETIAPLPFRRLAAAYPDNVDAVFRKILRKPNFTWAEHGEALLRRRKAWYYEREPRPGVSVIGARLAELARARRYLANWGTRRLMFRLPRGVLDYQTAGQYCYTDTASLIETGSHLLLSLYVDREPDDYWEEPGGQLAAMVQARSELAAGDLRLLYLARLLAIQSDEADDEDTEPPVPPAWGT